MAVADANVRYALANLSCRNDGVKREIAQMPETRSADDARSGETRSSDKMRPANDTSADEMMGYLEMPYFLSQPGNSNARQVQ